MPGDLKRWRYYHLVHGAYEIAREDDYARGTICACHNRADAEMVVNALNAAEIPGPGHGPLEGAVETPATQSIGTDGRPAVLIKGAD